MAASLLFGPLSPDEHLVEERLRTLALCVCALGVVGAALAYLRSVLVPFVLAVALKQMLAPIVNFLGLRLPRFAAVLLTLSFATALIVGIALILADSVRQFSAHATEYSAHIERLLNSLVSWMDTQGINHSVRLSSLKNLGEKLPLTTMILNVIENLLVTVSDLALVLLFAVFLLLGAPSPPANRDRLAQTVDAHLNAFIKGKVMLSVLTGVATGIILKALQVDLWLVRWRTALAARMSHDFAVLLSRFSRDGLAATCCPRSRALRMCRNGLATSCCMLADRRMVGSSLILIWIESHPRRSLACSPFGATSSRMWER